LNREFIPLELNLTDTSFPKSLPGLGHWKFIYGLLPRAEFGFTACVALTPDGKEMLADAGSSAIPEWKTSAHYHAEKFLEFLDKALEEWQVRPGVKVRGSK
jgi:hypothetical protein